MKCPNCGAEVSGGFCSFCGSQLSEETTQKVKCANCGSTNIAFKRENQGEIRGKKAKQIVHRTVGYCKDCGNTWYIAENSPKRRKTWLWVLGWIFIFPLPLTIILLRKKEMKPVIKYAIIAVAWVIYLIIALASKSNNEEKTVETLPPQTPAAVEQQANTIVVELSVSPNVNSDNGKVLFNVATNLPEDTKLMLTLTNDDGFMAQETITVLRDGVGHSVEFSNKGEGLKGKYHLVVSMSLPTLQAKAVQEIIGTHGENISGQYVVKAIDDETNLVRGEFDFEF